MCQLDWRNKGFDNFADGDLYLQGQYALFVSDSDAYLCTDTTFGSWFARYTHFASLTA